MTHDRRPLYAANWKMHMGPVATRAFVAEFRALYQPNEDRRVVFFPPAISVEAFRDSTSGRPDIGIGVQDVHAEAAGAHTGAACVHGGYTLSMSASLLLLLLTLLLMLRLMLCPFPATLNHSHSYYFCYDSHA